VSTERRIVRKAAQLVALAHELRDEGLADAADLPHPIFWPALAGEEAKQEWDTLRRWVDQLRARYPNLTRLPDCWWRHNDLVEVLAALRDFEGACFSATAPATAAVEWQRALRDMEVRMEIWIKRFACSVPGRGHDLPAHVDDAAPDGWAEFVQREIDGRRSERTASRRGAESPTPGPSN
jgi:hypothetical protein